MKIMSRLYRRRHRRHHDDTAGKLDLVHRANDEASRRLELVELRLGIISRRREPV